jgi:perosamine synthetase
MNEKLAINGGKPIRKKYLSYGHQWIDNKDISAITNVLKSDFITQGSKVKEFEDAIAKYCNTKYAVAFSSGTAALHGAAYSAGIKQNDEAITTPMTFVASSNCILYLNGKIKFADIKKDTYNLDSVEIKKKITKKTKVLLPVDYAGQPCDLDEIIEIAKENNLIVIEDASHAIGAEYKGKKIGGISDLTIFSFHPVKHITTGEGGMVLTNNKEYYEKLLMFRTHGITKNPKEMIKNEGEWYYEMQILGYNYRLTDIQCALGLSQLNKLNNFIKRRREIVKKYNKAFKEINEVITPYEKPDVKSSYHLYTIQLKLEKLKKGRKQIFDALRAENIGVHVHYIPVHLQPYYMTNFDFKKGDFPITEKYYERCLTIPLYPKMSNTDINDVIEGVKKVIKYYRR